MVKMAKSVKSFVLVASILMAAVIIIGCSSPAVGSNEGNVSSQPSTGPINGLVQSNSAGGVTVDVQWVGADNGSLRFDVAMDTYSVDLDQYDLKVLALLRDDEGKEYLPTLWDSDYGGHHRKGTLVFPVPDSLSLGKAKYLELVIREVAQGAERDLRWEL